MHAAGFHKGSFRSRRPLPSTRMLIEGRSMSSILRPGRQLGDAQPCADGHVQHCAMADAIA